MAAPKHDPKPVDHLSKLPTELLILIARFYLRSSEIYFSSIFRLTRTNSRLRQIIIATPDLWASFGISDAESESYDLVRLCIERSQSLPLDIQLYTFNTSQRGGLRDHFCDVLRPAAPRIRMLITYMTTYGGLNVVRGVLENLEMPMLEEVSLDYPSMFDDGPDRTIKIPGGGTNLRTLTLTGLVPINSNLSNLKSLTLGSTSGAWWQWSTSSISALVTKSTSLENLTFVGGECTFDVEDDSAGSVLLSPLLRHLGMRGRISANFATRFLLALHAPNLETVNVTTPSVCYETMVPADWEEVMDRLDEKYVEGNWTVENVRALVIDPEAGGYSSGHNRNFFRFLKNVFPYITSLDLDVAEIEVLRICKEENDVFDVEWGHLNKLILRGNPSPRALKRLLDFVRSRNGTGPVDFEGESEEEGGDEYDEADYDDEETEEDETDEEDEDEGSESKSEDGGEGGNEGASNEEKHEASGVVGAGVDEDAGSSWLMPIETVVIKGREITDAASGELLRLLREEVQVVEIA
ncbi:hypothetical protein FRC04_004805 [Tulasnella sp. 424]|nr:hypothetical protein FRC04_004805 [Tulasnella sp. 424]KAG8964992.1 hypothetical protein FRC05_003519 [Tulasnella sp. 425]